jgi:hypothetical protein
MMTETEMTEPKLNIVTASTSELPDPFDLDSLRLSQAFTETAGVKKLLRTVPIRKPNRQDFVHVHPSADYRADFAMIEHEREEYIVAGRDLISELTGEIMAKTLFTAITQQGGVFLWPVPLPNPDGRRNESHRSMREAADLGTTQWVRVKFNWALGAYEIMVPESAMAEPVWPQVTYQELIKLAFRDRLITDVDHPVVKRLYGLA